MQAEKEILDSWEVGVAIYAAVVATGALFLEIRRWFESGARLAVSVLSETELINVPEEENNVYVDVTVINRGSASTTITNLYLYVFDNWWQRLRCRPSTAAVAHNPSALGEAERLPKELGPGGVWHGLALHDENFKEWIRSGQLYVVIFASHTDKPIMRRVRPMPKPPADAEEI